ncbi:tyrosine-protein phosphatase [Leifsonia poae]|uniref:tyrosine-protein phosphatase n=1 Tax=Leifsonia poae TaxID=110933 RepID=UPI003D669DBB
MTDTLSRRRLPVEGTYNFRETDGYRAGAGAVRSGKLYRSDALHALTPSGRRAVEELGIRRVIDLRSDEEVVAGPSLLPDEAVIVHSPIFGATQPVTIGEVQVTLDGVYDLMIDQHGRQLTSAVRLIAESGDDPVLVHCTAGKDRTGLVIALALLTAGVEREEVIADYAQTAGNLAGPWAAAMLQRMTASGATVTPDLEEIVTASPAELMAAVIARWDAEWGSAAGYLRAHGLTDQEITALTTALVHPSTDTAN